MSENYEEKPPRKNLKIIAIVVIILLVGIALYLIFIGFDSDGRDDDASLSQIEEERGYSPIVLYFWGSNCAYCDDQKLIIEDLESDYKVSNVTFYWFDSNNHDDLVDHYNIRGVPTTIVLNRSGIEKKLVGLSDYDEIANAIENSILTYN